MPEQIVPTVKLAPRRAEQDQAIANLITEIQQMIGQVQADAELAECLAGRGYHAAKLAEGLALQQAAQAAFTARQTAMAAQKQASATAAEAENAARMAYTDFRATARALFGSVADRAALGLTGVTPKDAQKFITLARASYAAAQSEPYTATLSTYGLSAQAINAALTTLDTFSAADQAQGAAIAGAVQATTKRDAAAKELEQWGKQFRRIAAVALRAEPTQAKKLGV